jgi:hypothetical protein
MKATTGVHGAIPSRRLWLYGLALTLTISTTGCNVVMLMGYLIGGPPTIEPDFNKQTKKSLVSKGSKVKSVAIVCYADKELKWDNEAVDHELSRYVAYRLTSHKINVIDPDRIHAWMDEHADWDKPSEIGEALKADYVIYIDLKEFGLYEPNSQNMFRGHSDIIVSVFDVVDDDGHSIYSREIASRYPTEMPVSADTLPFENFKKLYLSRLSEEIGRLFYEHASGDDIQHSALN